MLSASCSTLPLFDAEKRELCLIIAGLSPFIMKADPKSFIHRDLRILANHKQSDDEMQMRFLTKDSFLFLRPLALRPELAMHCIACLHTRLLDSDRSIDQRGQPVGKVLLPPLIMSELLMMVLPATMFLFLFFSSSTAVHFTSSILNFTLSDILMKTTLETRLRCITMTAANNKSQVYFPRLRFFDEGERKTFKVVESLHKGDQRSEEIKRQQRCEAPARERGLWSGFSDSKRQTNTRNPK
jgi:hypothetical protein